MNLINILSKVFVGRKQLQNIVEVVKHGTSPEQLVTMILYTYSGVSRSRDPTELFWLIKRAINKLVVSGTQARSMQVIQDISQTFDSINLPIQPYDPASESQKFVILAYFYGKHAPAPMVALWYYCICRFVLTDEAIAVAEHRGDNNYVAMRSQFFLQCTLNALAQNFNKRDYVVDMTEFPLAAHIVQKYATMDRYDAKTDEELLENVEPRVKYIFEKLTKETWYEQEFIYTTFNRDVWIPIMNIIEYDTTDTTDTSDEDEDDDDAHVMIRESRTMATIHDKLHTLMRRLVKYQPLVAMELAEVLRCDPFVPESEIPEELTNVVYGKPSVVDIFLDAAKHGYFCKFLNGQYILSDLHSLHLSPNLWFVAMPPRANKDDNMYVMFSSTRTNIYYAERYFDFWGFIVPADEFRAAARVKVGKWSGTMSLLDKEAYVESIRVFDADTHAAVDVTVYKCVCDLLLAPACAPSPMMKKTQRFGRTVKVITKVASIMYFCEPMRYMDIDRIAYSLLMLIRGSDDSVQQRVAIKKIDYANLAGQLGYAVNAVVQYFLSFWYGNPKIVRALLQSRARKDAVWNFVVRQLAKYLSHIPYVHAEIPDKNPNPVSWSDLFGKLRQKLKQLQMYASGPQGASWGYGPPMPELRI